MTVSRDPIGDDGAKQRLDAFLHIAAHDLIAPLRGVSTLLTFIKSQIEADHGPLPTEVEKDFDLLKEICEQMSELLTDLAEFTGQVQAALPAQCVDPAAEISRCAAVAGFTPGQIVIGTLPYVLSQPGRLRAIWRLLLVDALERGRGGAITITGHASGRKAVLSLNIPAGRLGFAGGRRADAGLRGTFVNELVTQSGGEVRFNSESSKADETAVLCSLSLPLCEGGISENARDRRHLRTGN